MVECTLLHRRAQGRVSQSQNRRGTLRFPSQHEMSPSSIAPTPVVSGEAPSNSTVFLASHRQLPSTVPAQGNQPLSRELQAVLCALDWKPTPSTWENRVRYLSSTSRPNFPSLHLSLLGWFSLLKSTSAGGPGLGLYLFHPCLHSSGLRVSNASKCLTILQVGVCSPDLPLTHTCTPRCLPDPCTGVSCRYPTRNPSLLSGVLGTGLPGLGTEHLPGALCSGTGSPALGLCSPSPKRQTEEEAGLP